MNWNIERLIESTDGEDLLFCEIMKQLLENGVGEDTATMQALRTLSEMSWCLVEDTPTFFNEAIENIYYDLKIETLKAILGDSIFNAIYEE